MHVGVCDFPARYAFPPAATFQHVTNKGHPAGTFDGAGSRLYCYSPEMMALYALAEAIERAATLRAAAVQEIGMIRFDPARHFLALASRPN